ncbi:electron transport complex subunit RsxB [Hylemonella gracilis]|jgi:electron transport complex protein RnfB|uniref:Electron transport complex subunit RsxB n=1 Tax=Hylemonella gracilis TaxID=80880 RepID=A0A4P6UQD5_9BURK|nr:electron transport complex subunit RsxB [Hylemonella gracilis]QBK06540.1 electron transport complex subunit RsxB [Hylemonella gracilis]
MVARIAQVLAHKILDALPQTQCQRCGYPDCAAYAQAIASEGEAINRCPPGGSEGVARLAALTGQAVLPLDPVCGSEGPMTVAVIDEDWCIGCTLCLKACPTDAILGGNKRMHTVIANHCTGCELCIPVCPVDCIHMDPVGEAETQQRTGWAAWTQEQATTARQRYDFHQMRMRREARENDERLAAKARAKLADLPAHSLLTDPAQLERKRALIEAALAAAARRAQAAHPSHEDEAHRPDAPTQA